MFSVRLSKYLEVQLLDHTIRPCSALWALKPSLKRFSVLFPSNNGWELQRLQFSQQCPQTSNFIHSNRCVATSHCSLDLQLGADKWCWLASHRLGCHLHIFLVWHLLKYCPFKNYVIYTFYCWLVRVLSIIMSFSCLWASSVHVCPWLTAFAEPELRANGIFYHLATPARAQKVCKDNAHARNAHLATSLDVLTMPSVLSQALCALFWCLQDPEKRQSPPMRHFQGRLNNSLREAAVYFESQGFKHTLGLFYRYGLT